MHISYRTKQKFKNTTWTIKIVLIYIVTIKTVSHPLIYQNDVILEFFVKLIMTVTESLGKVLISTWTLPVVLISSRTLKWWVFHTKLHKTLKYYINFKCCAFSFLKFIVVHISYWIKQKIQKHYINSQNCANIYINCQMCYSTINLSNDVVFDKFCKM